MIIIYEVIIRQSRSGYFFYLDNLLIRLDFTFCPIPAALELGTTKAAIEGKVVKSNSEGVFFDLIVKSVQI